MNGSLAFTWVPNPKDLGVRPRFQYDNCIQSIRNLKLCCDSYEIYPEMTIAGNIHFHGVLNIKDKVKWFKKILPTFKYHGYVCIKPNPDKKWFEYMSKDKEMMEKLLGIKLPLIKE